MPGFFPQWGNQLAVLLDAIQIYGTISHDRKDPNGFNIMPRKRIDHSDSPGAPCLLGAHFPIAEGLHHAFYTALYTSRTLRQLISQDVNYAFISNSDNLGGVMAAFPHLHAHRFFNTDNIWIHPGALKDLFGRDMEFYAPLWTNTLRLRNRNDRACFAHRLAYSISV